MAIQDIRNPRWINENSAIMLEIQEVVDGEYVPFVAMENDVTEHGRQLFEAARDGQFGEVAAEAVAG